MKRGSIAKSFSEPILERALAARHAGDLFIAQCKNGPTHTTTQLRTLDAWVLVSTWSPVTTIGYEIKVSRSDFLRDQKIDQYLGLCHLFYLVAPKGLIAVEELPAGTGLIEAIGDGTRLVTRRRAARRATAMPIDLMTYVLMCRVQPKREAAGFSTRESRMDALQAWATEQKARGDLSYLLNKKIRERFDDQARRLQATEERQSRLGDIEKRLVELGFRPDEHVTTWRVENRLNELTGAIDQSGVVAALTRTKVQIEHLLGVLAEKQRASEKVDRTLDALKAGTA